MGLGAAFRASVFFPHAVGKIGNTLVTAGNHIVHKCHGHHIGLKLSRWGLMSQNAALHNSLICDVASQYQTFIHFPFLAEDFTQASMKAMPATPSSIPGNCTSLSSFLPARLALMA